MSAVDEILSQIPMSQLAAQLGVDEQTAEAAARQAIPTLLGGMQANAQDPGGERSLAGALDDHTGDSLLDGGVQLEQVDTAEGRKIVSNVFGDNSDQVARALGARTGDETLMKKLLPILAPIVLAYLAKKVQGTKYGDLLGPLLAGAAGGSLADLLKDMLGGGAGQPQQVPTQPPTQQAPTQQEAPALQTDQPTSNPPAGNEGLQVPDFGDEESTDRQRPDQQKSSHQGGGLMDILGDLLGFGRKH